MTYRPQPSAWCNTCSRLMEERWPEEEGAPGPDYWRCLTCGAIAYFKPSEWPEYW